MNFNSLLTWPTMQMPIPTSRSRILWLMYVSSRISRLAILTRYTEPLMPHPTGLLDSTKNGFDCIIHWQMARDALPCESDPVLKLQVRLGSRLLRIWWFYACAYRYQGVCLCYLACLFMVLWTYCVFKDTVLLKCCAAVRFGFKGSKDGSP